MPHVVLIGAIPIDECAARFEPFTIREGDLIVRVDRFYRENNDRAALLETLVVDRGHTQKFFIQIAAREDGVTVKLEPLTDPEKGPGVRRALALVAHHIRDRVGGEYGRTNIEEFLIR